MLDDPFAANVTWRQAATDARERIAAVLADLDRAMPGWGDVGTHGPDCWVVHAGCLAARIRRTLTGEDHPQ